MSKMIPAGIVTAYGAAVRGGYQGTYEDFCAALGGLTKVLEDFEGFQVEVTTLEPGESATADYSDGVLTLGIPAGETGNGIQDAVLNDDYTLTLNWTNGESDTVGPIRGATGQTPDFEIGTVQTLQPDQPASASITGTPERPVLNLAIPKGDPGQDGASDAGDVTYDPEEAYDEGTAGAELKHLSNAINTKAPVIINTASGDIASFADGADDMPVRKLVGTIEPVQALGTPSPENPLPISGWTGASIRNYDAYYIFKPTNMVPGDVIGTSTLSVKYLGNGEFEATLKNISSVTRTTVIPIEPFVAPSGTRCRLALNNSAIVNGGVEIRYAPNSDYDTWKFTAQNRVSTYGALQGKTINGFRFYANSGASNATIKFKVEFYRTGFHSVPINWNSEAGTIYGGTVTLNQDGSADVVSTMGNIASYNGETLSGAWISSMDVYAEGATPTTGAQVVYKLATPVTYHFSDIGQLKTFLGTNNVWIDTGSITELDYPADTKLYIDGLTEPDEDMIADDVIASGKYFVVNNNLYLSTASIAKGAKIIPGTNCTATNLAEALNALNT